MRASLALFIALVLGALGAAVAPGDTARATVVLGAFALAAGLRVVLLALWHLAAPRDRRDDRPARRTARPAGREAAPAPRPAPARPEIVVDGSNVMFWDGETPTFRALDRVLTDLVARGYAPVVFFDANAGYRLIGRYATPEELASHLPDGIDSVCVMDKGIPADVALIDYALTRNLRIVSNDRFRDWRGQFPRVASKGVLVPGSLRGGQVRLAV